MFRQLVKIFIIVFVVFVNFYPLDYERNTIIYQNQVAVIVYHHLDNRVQGDITITPSLFKAQLSDLLRNGYHFITLSQFKDFFSGHIIPDNAILVTFDDGYESFYTQAYPILKQMSIPAVNFVITKDLEDPTGTSIPSLSREEIKTMVEEDNQIDFQCHSDHLHALADGKPLLTNKIVTNGIPETDQQYNQRISSDTSACMDKLSLLYNRSVAFYAYPLGAYNMKSINLLKEAGIQYGFTTMSGMATPLTSPMLIPRINAGSPFVHTTSVNNLILKSIKSKIVNAASKNELNQQNSLNWGSG